MKNPTPNRYLLTGGGTAGHVYPALAIAERLLEKEPKAAFLYVGTRNGAEERIVSSWGIPIQTLSVRGLPPGKSPFRMLAFALALALSTGKAVGTMLRFKPHAVIGTGGYASAPVFLAALLLRPLGLWKGILSLHEQNIIPGRFNLWMSRGADFIGTSFPETRKFFPKEKAYWTGYPIRRSVERSSRFAPGTERETVLSPDVPPSSKVLLVFGGSSGARAINDALWKTLPELLQREDLTVFHATGHVQGSYDPEEDFRRIRFEPQYAEAMKQRYHRKPYFDHLESYYGMADLVVARSGAGAVWEIASTNLRCLLIPKPGLPGDHQVKNARFFERYGRARILYETGGESGSRQTFVDPQTFHREILALLYDNASIEKDAPPIDIPCGSERFVHVLGQFLSGASGREMSLWTLSDPSSFPPGNRPEARPLEWIPLSQLPVLLERKRTRNEKLLDPDKRFLRSKVDLLLQAPEWEQRNLGVKIAGLIGAADHLPSLIHCITDRTPAPLFQRMLGGDYRQVGFIRRNALQALWRIHAYDAGMQQALIQALSDPYFEVRSFAARAVTRLSDLIGPDPDLERFLRRNLKDRWFEVVVASLEPLGECSRDPGILSDLMPLLEHHNWKVQETTVRCMIRLMERGVVRLESDEEARMKKIPMKGLDFSPRFQLQKTWESFLQIRSRGSAEARSSEPD